MAEKRTPCRYYNGGKGYCRFGNNCTFLHEKPTDQSNTQELECLKIHPWISPYDRDIHDRQKNIEQKQQTLLKSVTAFVAKDTPDYQASNWKIHMLPNQPVLECIDDGNKENLFDIENEHVDIIDMSRRMARVSQLMLEYITMMDAEKPLISFNNQFRLELTPVRFHDPNAPETIRNLWELRLNLDPVAWFDKRWGDAKTEVEKDEFLVTAREYVDKYRHFVEEEFLEPSAQEPIVPPRYCDYPTSCVNSKQYGHLKHATLICNKAKLQKTDGNRPCGQYFFNELVVMDWPVTNCLTKRFPTSNIELGPNFDWNTTRFILHAKKEVQRDLVLFPMPPWHLSNKQLVRLPVFWEHAILLCRFLRDALSKRYEEKNIPHNSWCIDGIGLNFGRWETAGSEDKRAVDCHGHAHLLLKLAFINQCDDTFFPTLKGRQEAPTNYYRQNAELIEKERLISCEMKQNRVTMKELNRKIDENNTMLKELLATYKNSTSN